MRLSPCHITYFVAAVKLRGTMLTSLPGHNVAMFRLQAVEAYTKRGQYKEAIQTCVRMNNWGLAVDLAHAHPDQTAMVEGFFTKFVDPFYPIARDIHCTASQFIISNAHSPVNRQVRSPLAGEV